MDVWLLEGTAGGGCWSQEQYRMEESQGKKVVMGRCVASESWCKDLVITTKPSALQERCTLPQMGKWHRRSDNQPDCSSQHSPTNWLWSSPYSHNCKSSWCMEDHERYSVSLLLARTYNSSSLISRHVCGSKKTRGRKHRAPKQYVVGAPMEWIAIDILGPLPETQWKNKFILVVRDYSLNGLRATQHQTKRQLHVVWLRS